MTTLIEGLLRDLESQRKQAKQTIAQIDHHTAFLQNLPPEPEVTDDELCVICVEYDNGEEPNLLMGTSPNRPKGPTPGVYSATLVEVATDAYSGAPDTRNSWRVVRGLRTGELTGEYRGANYNWENVIAGLYRRGTSFRLYSVNEWGTHYEQP